MSRHPRVWGFCFQKSITGFIISGQQLPSGINPRYGNQIELLDLVANNLVFFKTTLTMIGGLCYTCNISYVTRHGRIVLDPSTWEAGAGESPKVSVCPGLHGAFQSTLS